MAARVFRAALHEFSARPYTGVRFCVILSEAPPRSHFGYASCFLGKPKKFDKLRMTPAVCGGAKPKPAGRPALPFGSHNTASARRGGGPSGKQEKTAKAFFRCV